MLQARGVPAATVAHTSARIGDSLDTWESGVVSHANAAARARGITPGSRLRAAVERWIAGQGQP
jgi:nucleotidyltransferase/DNA polymerase involved in DNA repair